MSWHEGPLLGFDLETTGTNPFEARIVTASLVWRIPGEDDYAKDYLLNLGVEIPAAATAVHGVSTYKAQTEGEPPAEALRQIRGSIDGWGSDGLPLVVFNAAYDLTLLDAELTRYGLEPIIDYRPVLDPFVIDKQADKYRKGKRTLTACCEQYGVELEAAHTSGADALAAVQLTLCLAEKYPELQGEATQVHDWSIKWRAEQCASLQDYFRKTKDPETVINGDWPIQLQEDAA